MVLLDVVVVVPHFQLSSGAEHIFNRDKYTDLKRSSTIHVQALDLFCPVFSSDLEL